MSIEYNKLCNDDFTHTLSFRYDVHLFHRISKYLPERSYIICLCKGIHILETFFSSFSTSKTRYNSCSQRKRKPSFYLVINLYSKFKKDNSVYFCAL